MKEQAVEGGSRPATTHNRGISGLRERIALLAPFVVGGVAALWLLRVSEEPAVAGVGWVVSALAVATSFLLLTTAPSAKLLRRSRVRRERAGSSRWEARSFGSMLVRILAVLGPIGASLATALAVQRALPAPEGGLAVAVQALLLMFIGFAVLYPAERATRKLAPVAMLLKLSLSFPSVAPSRFVVARRSADVRGLREDLESGRGDPAATMLSLIATLTAHDSRTRGHSERVRVFAEMLAEELNVSVEARERLRWAALMHDIGKLAVSADILNKPARLDADQWQAMYKHPVEGARLVAPLAPWLGEWADGVVQHHERLDGSGYPAGLREGQISLGARIIAVADAYDTMVTPRTYHRPMAASAAREEVVRVSGMQFDPQVVRALLSLSIPRLWWRIGIGAWLAQLPLLRPRRPSKRRSDPSAASGVANVVGLAAITAVSVLAPLGSVETPLRAVPGLSVAAAEAEGGMSQPDAGAIPVEPSRPLRERASDAGEDANDDAESSPAPETAEVADGGGGATEGGNAGDGGGSSEGGPGGGAGSEGPGGSVGGAGTDGGIVGGAGTSIEANEDAIIAGQAPPPTPGPDPAVDASTPDPGTTPGEDPGDGRPSTGSGHDKCNGEGHQHHQHDDC